MAIIAYHYAHHHLSLRPFARYPLNKFQKLYDAAQTHFPSLVNVRAGDYVEREMLLLAHSDRYVAGIESGELPESAWRGLGFVWSTALYPRANCIVDCTYQACRVALQDGIGFVLGGGAHHAAYDVGKGFCVFNDVVLASRMLQQNNLVQKILVFDCDVHQGDGTALLCSHDDLIFTCSIHSQSNFPFRKATSDLDVGLDDDISDEAYVFTVKTTLNQLLREHSFDLMIYIAGADPYVEDTLGKLSISKPALRERDHFVFSQCYEHEIPVGVVFGGGYCSPIDKTIACNINTLQAALEVYI
ncbi:MAG: histone deacetylase [Bdellovibrionales bacterium]|nr:histone deacetylase [Bdellovibrionales bacterium]